MECKLSFTDIHSFVGNVLPLRLLGVEAYGMEEIRWEVSAPCVQLTTFDQDEAAPFTDGVLLTLLFEGEATVTAVYQEQAYSCCVLIRKRMQIPSQKGLSYYVGNFHDHTARTHDPVEFPLRKEGVPGDYLKQLTDEGKMDFTAISDHADLLNGREFFRGFWDAFSAGEEMIVAFSGSEAEVSPLFDDRYGVEHKVGGEVVVVNADSFTCTPSWREFFARYETSPFAIGVLAHPQIIGISRKGVWNFELDKHRTPKMMQLLRGVEMGDGTDNSSNLINEYTYSVALDNGFRVSTTCSSDRHGPVWGASLFPGKTILMAPEKSREAFLDALDHCRFYASESGNVKLYYEVNGCAAPATLHLCDTYRFSVEIDLLEEAQGGMPVKLQVISDYGKTLWQTCEVKRKMEFAIESSTARWFYLRLTDESGKRTWSVPVWTGREFDETRTSRLMPIAKTGMTAVEERSSRDASVLLSDDPTQTFFAEEAACSILVDMGKVQSIGALGLYHTMLDRKVMRAAGEKEADRIAQFPVHYQLETGLTPDAMTLQAQGLFRVFGGEEMVYFTNHEARFVRLRILSNAGAESGRPWHQNHRTSMAELTLYR